MTIEEAVKKADLIVECSEKQAVYEIASKTLNSGKDIMLMSTSGLVEHMELLELAREKNCCIYLPSGAIAGLDGVKSAAVGKIESVTLTTTKNPKALASAPYVIEKKINIEEIKSKTVIFDGMAKEAVKGFPANINVCVALSLAGIGLDKTKVKIIADPAVHVNIHEIEVKGDVGRIYTRVENIPSPVNPKTSFLAALSAIATFKRIIDPVKIGT
jgi:aspartate dehydrogenase